MQPPVQPPLQPSGHPPGQSSVQPASARRPIVLCALGAAMIVLGVGAFAYFWIVGLPVDGRTLVSAQSITGELTVTLKANDHRGLYAEVGPPRPPAR